MTFMQYLIIVATLFVIGAVGGWILEVFFRRFFSQKKWVNPGFMVGPWLPLYGFGTIMLYGISNIDFSFMGGDNNAWVIIIKILIIGVGMTLIEFIAGLIFIKGMKIKLWDYSNRWGNIMGIICPLFSFLWLLVGVFYFYCINPYLVTWITWISENTIYSFFIGIVIGAVIVDCCYSIHLATKLSAMAKDNKLVLSLDTFKSYIKEKYSEGKKKLTIGSYIYSHKNKETLNNEMTSYKSFLLTKPEPKKWWYSLQTKRIIKKAIKNNEITVDEANTYIETIKSPKELKNALKTKKNESKSK